MDILTAGRSWKRLAAAAVAGPLLLASVPSAAGDVKMKVLGTDPKHDAPPGLDLVSIAAGRNGRDLEIRIEIEGMFPPGGGYPQVPAIAWTFHAKKRTFIVEAVATQDRPRFFLFEIRGDSFEQLESPEGTYDWTDGFVRVLVPLKAIGARKGTRISGAREDGFDVDAHIHAGSQEVYADTMTTTKDFVVP